MGFRPGIIGTVIPISLHFFSNSKKEMEYIDKFDCIIKNDELNNATKNIIGVVEKFILM